MQTVTVVSLHNWKETVASSGGGSAEHDAPLSFVIF